MNYLRARIYLHVLQEALYAIGRLWEANRITVADEHLGTAITQFVLSQLYPLLDRSPIDRGTLVLTGVQGELHQVGANMVADSLESDGWNVVFLGTDTPVDGVVDSIARHRPAVFGVSSTMLFNVPRVAQLVQRVRSTFGAAAPRILLGGSAFRASLTLPPELAGCSVGGDLTEAVAVARAFGAGVRAR